MAFRVDKQTLSDKLFVKECVHKNFNNVRRKADHHARNSMADKEYALQSDYEAKLEHVVYDNELKMVEDKFSNQTLSNELNAAKTSKEELCLRVAAVEFAYVEK